jgi:hypothetical protein
MVIYKKNHLNPLKKLHYLVIFLHPNTLESFAFASIYCLYAYDLKLRNPLIINMVLESGFEPRSHVGYRPKTLNV